MTLTNRLIEVRANILKENDLLARSLRRRFQAEGTLVISLVASPGAGKTALLEATLSRLRERFRVGALVGDLATDNDARRLSRAGVPVRQISTGTLCHLEARMIESALRDFVPEPLEILFIENVGNLVCPASFDLGETIRAVLLSVTEGDDKPLKYPTIFNTADLAILSKIDLLGTGDFDPAAARRHIERVRPGMELLGLSTRSGEGFDRWIDWLNSRWTEFRRAVSVEPRGSSGR
jgi:hydrogenase nickel incorporation protein HypB